MFRPTFKFPFLTLLFFFIRSAVAQQAIPLVYHWEDTTFVGSNAFGNIYNEVWGFVQDGKEYAVLGTTEGTHIFDVSDTTAIYEAVFVEGRVTGGQIIHRDYHDYNGYLYMVSDEGPSSLQIANLSFLPDSAPVVYDDNTLFSRAHNIFIDTNNAILYTCGGNTQFSLYDLSNPENPTLLLNCQQSVSFWDQIGYVHDAYVVDNVAYLHAEGRGMYVVDFADINNPQVLGSITNYPDKGYNHSGWMNEDKTVYAMADETWGMDVKILDVSNLSDIKVLSTVNSNVDTNFSIAHNLIIKGDYLYISYYYDGVYIYDISDPANPILDGMYDTSPLSHRRSYEGCWGVYPLFDSGLLVAGDMQEGLFLFDASTYLPDSGSGSAGIQEVKNHDISVFPNPTNQVVSISVRDYENTSMLIFDLNGKLIHQRMMNSSIETVNLDRFEKGIYNIAIQNPTSRITKKLVLH